VAEPSGNPPGPLHACRTCTLCMPAKTPLASDKIDTPAACTIPFCPYCGGFVKRMQNVSEYMLVLAICLVYSVASWCHSVDVNPVRHTHMVSKRQSSHFYARRACTTINHQSALMNCMSASLVCMLQHQLLGHARQYGKVFSIICHHYCLCTYNLITD